MVLCIHDSVMLTLRQTSKRDLGIYYLGRIFHGIISLNLCELVCIALLSNIPPSAIIFISILLSIFKWLAYITKQMVFHFSLSFD
jgi:hypothetical protein